MTQNKTKKHVIKLVGTSHSCSNLMTLLSLIEDNSPSHKSCKFVDSVEPSGPARFTLVVGVTGSGVCSDVISRSWKLYFLNKIKGMKMPLAYIRLKNNDYNNTVMTSQSSAILALPTLCLIYKRQNIKVKAMP